MSDLSGRDGIPITLEPSTGDGYAGLSSGSTVQGDTQNRPAQGASSNPSSGNASRDRVDGLTASANRQRREYLERMAVQRYHHEQQRLSARQQNARRVIANQSSSFGPGPSMDSPSAVPPPIYISTEYRDPNNNWVLDLTGSFRMLSGPSTQTPPMRAQGSPSSGFQHLWIAQQPPPRPLAALAPTVPSGTGHGDAESWCLHCRRHDSEMISQGRYSDGDPQCNECISSGHAQYPVFQHFDCYLRP